MSFEFATANRIVFGSGTVNAVVGETIGWPGDNHWKLDPGELAIDVSSGVAVVLRGVALEWTAVPGNANLDCEIPGILPPEEMGRILEEIRRAAEHQGAASEVLGGMEWKTVGELSAVNVNISPRGKSTSIQIVGNRGPAAGITFIFPMMGAGVLVGILGATFEPTSAVGIVSLVAGTLGTGFLTARTIWSSTSKKFRARLTRLMDRVSLAVEKATLRP